MNTMSKDVDEHQKTKIKDKEEMLKKINKD
jgi:hypothetical protein